jgi:hypothetical protein
MFKKILIIICIISFVFVLTAMNGCQKKAEQTPKMEQHETTTPPADTTMQDTTAMDTSNTGNM